MDIELPILSYEIHGRNPQTPSGETISVPRQTSDTATMERLNHTLGYI